MCRTALDDAFQAYVNEHFPNGVVTVYGSNGSYTVAIVDNKDNPRNYWYALRIQAWPRDGAQRC